MKIVKRIKGRIVDMDFLGEKTITIKEYRKRKLSIYHVDDTIFNKNSITMVHKGEGNSNDYLEIEDIIDILIFDVEVKGVSVQKSLFGNTKPSNEKFRDDGEFYTLDFENDDFNNAPF